MPLQVFFGVLEGPAPALNQPVREPMIIAARKATTTIPIVMTAVGDPVGRGFVASLARPGGNIAGVSNLAVELTGKRVELIKEAVPKASMPERSFPMDRVFGTTTAGPQVSWFYNLTGNQGRFLFVTRGGHSIVDFPGDASRRA